MFCCAVCVSRFRMTKMNDDMKLTRTKSSGGDDASGGQERAPLARGHTWNGHAAAAATTSPPATNATQYQSPLTNISNALMPKTAINSSNSHATASGGSGHHPDKNGLESKSPASSPRTPPTLLPKQHGPLKGLPPLLLLQRVFLVMYVSEHYFALQSVILIVW